jgi:hypothetical protein
VDLSQFSDEELMRAVGGGVGKAPAAAMDLSQFSDEELMKAAGMDTAAPVQPEPAQDTFGSRLQADFDRRKRQISDLANLAVKGDISEAEAIGRSGLKMAQLLPDTALNVLSEVTPDFIEKPVVEQIGNAASYLADTRAGRATIGAINDFNQQYPITAGRVGSAVDALNIALPFKKVGGESLVSASSKVADAAIDKTGKAVGMAGRAAAKALTPSVQEGLVDVALSARKFDIPLSLDQVTGSRALKNVQKVSQELPFSGQQGFREAQMRAYNKALFKTVGVEADAFTPKNMALAFDKVGGEFDAVTKGKTFGIGGNFIDDLVATAEDVRSQYGDEAFNAFQREASKVISDFQGDSISGELISRQRGRINALARKASPGQKEALLDLENTIVDGITSGDPAIEAALSQAKQRYKNLIVLEPVATKAKGGMISPSLLNNRVASVYKRAYTLGNSGDIGELARVGYELLPELGGSDTTQKLLTVGAAGSMLSNPVSIAPLAVGVGGNRAFQSAVNRNQSLVNAAIKKSEAEQLKRLTKQDLQAAFEAKKKLPMTDTFLDMPPIPTPEQMKKFSTVQKVSLSDVEGNQRVREFDKFNKGIFAEPLIAGYSDMPVAVKFKNGKYLLLDGHHRTDIALNKGKSNMEMRVIEAKDYTNIDRKPIKESKFTAEDADILEKLLKE